MKRPENNLTGKELRQFLRDIDIPELMAKLGELSAEIRRVNGRQQILRSLLFRSIKQRHSAIQDRHKATFDWIFTKQNTTFCDWLEIGNGFFWVKGKAGSGKSTLMKFLASHTTAEAKLRLWSGGRRVIMASHVFWNSGTSMQKSLTGLVQTLLYQILRECPELIDIVCASRWAALSDSALFEPWDETGLLESFEILAKQTSLPLKLCFSIDGLDEYTAGVKHYNGTFTELVQPLKTLATSGFIKICISSRPWPVFNSAFKDDRWMMQLEDLTNDDIRNYVKEELGKDDRFKQLSGSDERCMELPNVIVGRAQGVFLWVYLVINSLKRGLGNDDNFEDLQRRLDELPVDLQKYFEHMLESIEETYWDQATRIFRVVVAAEQALPLFGFEFLDQESADPGFTIKMPVQRKTRSEISTVCERLKTRLNARCRDLLYVADHPREPDAIRVQVDFLHRTVRDFFVDTGVLDGMIEKRPTKNFDPLQTLCRMMLGLSKIAASPEASDHSRLYSQPSFWRTA